MREGKEAALLDIASGCSARRLQGRIGNKARRYVDSQSDAGRIRAPRVAPSWGLEAEAVRPAWARW